MNLGPYSPEQVAANRRASGIGEDFYAFTDDLMARQQQRNSPADIDPRDVGVDSWTVRTDVTNCDHADIQHYATAELDNLIDQGMDPDVAVRVVNARINSTEAAMLETDHAEALAENYRTPAQVAADTARDAVITAAPTDERRFVFSYLFHEGKANAATVPGSEWARASVLGLDQGRAALHKI